jgi:hypothetical protein
MSLPHDILNTGDSRMSYNVNQSVLGSPNPRIHTAITAQGALRFGKGDSQVKEIPLTRGKVALVDEEDYEWLMGWKWYAAKGHRSWYAARNARVEEMVNGKRRAIYMHREILQPPDGMDTDHRNGNGLDNQRYNLRVCTHPQNMRNQKPHINTLSPFKGVDRDKRTGKWRARVQDGGQRISLGLFDTEEQAALAYNQAAIKLYGDYARPNQVYPILTTMEKKEKEE